eukprot:TRINITY_DN5185_c0_g1_i1.p1 TRINITY_DN5185_c0_g1~~TRINITY_DN5185_c0_g1_i1.p1  ORF type:complete len:291 (+),score=35.28 TRINITY_DN5185_c0_g1_i1:107-979(+)
MRETFLVVVLSLLLVVVVDQTFGYDDVSNDNNCTLMDFSIGVQWSMPKSTNTTDYYSFSIPSSATSGAQLFLAKEIIDNTCQDQGSYLQLDWTQGEKTCPQPSPTSLKGEYIALNLTQSSTYSIAVSLHNSSCTWEMVVMQVHVTCDCVGHSECDSSYGCKCLSNWWSPYCNISGPCYPFAPPSVCGIPAGTGLGNQTCLFVDPSTKSSTQWGPCILYECLPGYTLINNDCVKNGTKPAPGPDSDSDHPSAAVRISLIVVGCVVFVAVAAVIIVFVRSRIHKRHHYQSFH